MRIIKWYWVLCNQQTEEKLSNQPTAALSDKTHFHEERITEYILVLFRRTPHTH